MVGVVKVRPVPKSVVWSLAYHLIVVPAIVETFKFTFPEPHLELSEPVGVAGGILSS